MQNLFDKEGANRMGKMLFCLIVVVALYVGMKFVNQVKTFGTIGVAPEQVMTIDASGEGSAVAVPDIATINFNVEAKGKTVATAQELVNTRVNQAMDFLKQSNIDTKDIQTTNYNSYPEYSNPCVGSYNAPCPVVSPSVSQVVDYDVSQNVTVKIRKTDAVGAIVDGLGKVQVSGISGPSFTVDNPDAVKAEAKQKAIDDAKAKAVTLASQLGLHLGKIVRFSDSGNSPTPIMYDTKAMVAGASAPSTEANLSTGQSTYTSDVVITYEIY